ncbi:MAG: hypothetical protein HYS74_02305 [Parcubacteria group bacterium]|nr:hypothetical protein [Parcubacteria group bacterium]
MKLFLAKSTALAAALLVPAGAFAQQIRIGSRPRHLGDVVSLALQLLALLVPLLVALALVVFLWGVFRYVVATGAEDKSTAQNVIIAGLIGLFVMLGVWGLVGIIAQTVGVPIFLPLLPPGTIAI